MQISHGVSNAASPFNSLLLERAQLFLLTFGFLIKCFLTTQPQENSRRSHGSLKRAALMEEPWISQETCSSIRALPVITYLRASNISVKVRLQSALFCLGGQGQEQLLGRVPDTIQGISHRPWSPQKHGSYSLEVHGAKGKLPCPTSTQDDSLINGTHSL